MTYCCGVDAFHCIRLHVCLKIGGDIAIGVGRHSSVGIATRYKMVGPGIESRWGRNFLHISRRALGPIQPPI